MYNTAGEIIIAPVSEEKMTKENRKNLFAYRLDENDTIISVSKNWGKFAEKNAWYDSDSVIGNKIWEYVQGFETAHLYEELFHRVRKGVLIGAIPFRCDSPEERRYLKLHVQGLPNNHLIFRSMILRTIPREPLRLLDVHQRRSGSKKVKVCSMCKKIEEEPGVWLEMEDSLISSRLFEHQKIPKITHGLCESCYQIALAELSEIA